MTTRVVDNITNKTTANKVPFAIGNIVGKVHVLGPVFNVYLKSKNLILRQ